MAAPERERAGCGVPGRLPRVDRRPDLRGHQTLGQLRHPPPRPQGSRPRHGRRVGPQGQDVADVFGGGHLDDPVEHGEREHDAHQEGRRRRRAHGLVVVGRAVRAGGDAVQGVPRVGHPTAVESRALERLAG